MSGARSFRRRPKKVESFRGEPLDALFTIIGQIHPKNTRYNTLFLLAVPAGRQFLKALTMPSPRALLSFICNNSMTSFARIFVLLALGLTSLVARDGGPTVQYLPTTKLIEGDQPLHTSYVLSITSPTNVSSGSNLVISPVVASVSRPAGVNSATALSFISLSATTLTFTEPGQTLTTTVTVSVPEGATAGDYVWSISTPGWPSGTIDAAAYINAKITVPLVPSAPTVTLSAPLDGAVYTYTPGGPAVSIPLSFTATAPAISPITSVDADVSGAATGLSATGIGSSFVQANGTLLISAPGVYTVRARATNNAGTSADTADFTVQVGTQPPSTGNCTLDWLPPISLGKVQKGGSVLPIKFDLNGDCGTESIGSVLVFVYEILANGTNTEAQIFTAGPANQPGTYSINGNHYQLNYVTASGSHRYHVEVYRSADGSAPQLLGTKEFTTR